MRPSLGRRPRGGWIRRLTSTAGHRWEDEGAWAYSPEWWDTDSPGQCVFRATSHHGNGIVSVVAYPASRPAPEQWPRVERWLQERYMKIHSLPPRDGEFRILSYQWRALHFNDDTRQSTSKVMVAYRTQDPTSLYVMQQPHCLAIPYVKSMVSVGLTTLASSYKDLPLAVSGSKKLNILCIGHGGGCLPLFLASKIRGALVDVVEIDPIVVSASIEAMGFPSTAAKQSSEPSDMDHILWEPINKQLALHVMDAEDFILQTTKVYDVVFVDAYDGKDIFPRKLWDADGSFLQNLQKRVHLVHGTVVVNLHSDQEASSSTMDAKDFSFFDNTPPLGRYISQVSQSYKKHIGSAFTVSVPWLCNITLVASRKDALCGGARRGVAATTDFITSKLFSEASYVDSVLDMPFHCLQYVNREFRWVD